LVLWASAVIRMQTLSQPLPGIFSHLPSALKAQLYAGAGQGAFPRRILAPRPEDNGSFILPLKQSFVKDARLMPGTRCMLALLAGWAGQGRTIEQTEGIIARHLGRSVRQVYRYLQDASREGYLRYAYTKNRAGMITGLKIWLRFELLRPAQKQTRSPKPQTPARTHRADTNKNYIYIDETDSVLNERLGQLRQLIERS
jgi:hypothetical protein